MEPENIISPSMSMNNLLDFSGKQVPKYAGNDLIEDPSFFRQCSGISLRGMDLSELSPNRLRGKIPVIEKKSELPQNKPDFSKVEQKDIINQFSDDELALNTKEPDFPTNEQLKSTIAGPRESAPDFRKLIAKGKNPVLAVKTNSFLGNLGTGTPSGIERSASLKSASSRKSRKGSIATERQNSEVQHLNASPTNSPKLAGTGMSFVGLIAMAKKMGLIKRTHAYEDYMSKDQFNMIKDLSTGKFDPKEEKRSEQMTRLKSKLFLTATTQRRRVPKKRTHIMEWKNNLFPSLKRMYYEIKRDLTRVIAPNGAKRVIWDLYTMLLIFYDLILLPLTLSFDFDMPYGLVIWDKIMTASFFLDIALNFDTGFYYKGVLVMDRKKIFQYYMKGWFWVDILASFPYSDAIQDQEDSGGSSSYSIIRIIRFLKFIKIFRFIRIFKLKNLFIKLESYIDLSGTATSVIGFLKLSLITLFIAHWFACIWHFISVVELEDHPETWLTRHGVVDDFWVDRYVASIYWATTTMITVGYGDIVPITVNEKLIAVIAMLVASAVFAYTMNRINVILDGLETTSEQYQHALSTITGYMRKKRVKKELQIKIKKYLEYALEVETSFDSNENYLNAYLNQSLKNELILEVHGRTLLENEIFLHFDNSLIMKAALIMKERMFSPEDPIFFESENNDPSIFLIQSGRVEIFNFRTHSYLKTLLKGNHFGEFSFFTGQARSASARSTDFSALYLVRRCEFMELLNEFPLEKEKFHEIKDKLSVYQDQIVLNSKCYSCNASDHIVNDCPKVHAVVPRDKFIRSYVEKRKKFMTSYIRTGKRSDKSPVRYNVMANAVKQLQLKIWEGECTIDKALQLIASNIDLPELNEHPPLLLSPTKPKKSPSMSQGGTIRVTRTTSADPNLKNPPPFISTNFDLESEGSEGNESGRIEARSKYISTIITTPRRMFTKKEIKIDIMEDDIDKIQNFLYYFPKNNFESLFPPLEGRRLTLFDYFSQSDTAKDTMKKFIAILKEKTRARRENTAKEKEDTRRRSSLLKRLGMGGGKSKFYQERPSVSGPPAKKSIFALNPSPVKMVKQPAKDIPRKYSENKTDFAVPKTTEMPMKSERSDGESSDSKSDDDST